MTEDPKILQAMVKRNEQKRLDLEMRINQTVEYLLLMKKSPELTGPEKRVIEMALQYLD